MLKGWIVAHAHEAEHLQSLGIKLGTYVPEKLQFTDCEVTYDQVEALKEFYGTYYWYLV